MDILAHASPYLGFMGLGVALFIYLSVRNRPAGNEKMQEIAGLIYEGSMAFLRREYRISPSNVELTGARCLRARPC